MEYEHENMTVEVMETMINNAYNDITFKNALVCCLDWANWHRCAYIHKDSKIGVDDEGYIINKYTVVKEEDRYQLTSDTSVQSGKMYFDKISGKYYAVLPEPGDDPQSEGWYEYVNPYSKGWYEKHTRQYEYSEVPAKDLSYYVNPNASGWYEFDGTNYILSTDNNACGESISSYHQVNPNAGDNPRDLGWYIYDPSLDHTVPTWGFIPTNDTNVVGGRTYYYCSYKTYYKQIERKVTEYVITFDTVVEMNKPYYTWKNAEETRELPDFTSKYSRRISIDIPGIENEVTLTDKRPAQLGGW